MDVEKWGMARRSLATHAWSVLLLLALSLAWSFPLILNLGSRVPGQGAGDNLTFVWDVWWMRQALHSPDLSFFRCPLLFVPFGFDLTLHTHTALPALLGATVLGSVSVLAAQNLLLIGSLFLNGLAAYLLAFEVTGDRHGSLVAGLVFGGSPYVMAHLHGHFNLVAAWGLPLFALLLVRALARRSMLASAGAGLALVAVTYTDYYYVVYALLFGLVYVALDWFTLSVQRGRASPTWMLQMALGALLLDGALIVGIAVSGGFSVNVGPQVISVTRVENPLRAGWGLLLLWMWLRWRPRVRLVSREGPAWRTNALLLLPVAALFLVGIAPLVSRSVSLWQAGEYVSQRYLWRSAPPGIDVVSLVAGNPFHPFWGSVVGFVYDTLHLDPIEGVAWVGVVPLFAVATLVSRRRQIDAEAKRWLLMSAVFLVWALGPYLTVVGINTNLILPEILLRFVPIASNARIPGRAIVMVYLALAVLVAMWVAKTTGNRRRPGIAWLVSAAVVLDFLAAPFPTFTLEVPQIYYVLRDARGGRNAAVCELPLGVRDGFGETGSFDERVLYYQTVHGHPLVGGFAARLPPRIRQEYLEMPVIGGLLRLSGGEPLSRVSIESDPDRATGELRQRSIGYVVLDRATAPPDLIHYVDSTLRLRLVATDGQRELYSVGGL
jgi:hypothetical protein